MTTIAYKDGIVAGDSRISLGAEVLSDDFLKLFEVAGGAVIALVGNTASSTAFAEYLDSINYFTLSAEPDFWKERSWKDFFSDEDDGQLLIFFSDHIESFTHHGITKHKLEPIAFGSGTAYALSAMALGLSAVQAVKHAAKFDTYTNTNVRHYELRMAAND